MSTKASPTTSLTDMDPPGDTNPAPISFSSSPLPCWATQALCDLAKSETDMRRLRERQSIETESVSRGLERAVMGVHREERRLLERVEQDQRDAQQRLEQLRRENAAAIRVALALLDQRLKKVAQLRLQVQTTGAEAMRSDSYDVNQRRDDLLKNVAELLQPWEISLSLKRVCFKPSSQAKPISFGEIKIQDHNLSFPVGGCGAKGQLCALHASGGHYGEQGVCTQDGRSTPEGAGPGQGQGQVMSSSSGSGNLRVVRKLRLSARSDEESGEDMKRTSQRWPPKRDSSERDSSQDEEQESPPSELRGDCLFLAVPNLVGNADSEGEDGGTSGAGKTHRHNFRDKRSHLSHREASPFLEQGSAEQEGWYFRSFEISDSKRDRGKGSRQDSTRTLSRFGYATVPSPRSSPRDSLSSHSCLDLSSQNRPRSRLSVCSDDHPHGTYGETAGGRPSSPTDSVDSGYTFIISSPRDYAGSVGRNSRLSKSTVDLSQRNRPLINGSQQGDTSGLWKVHRSRFSSSSASPTLSRGVRRTVGRAFSCTAAKEPGLQHSQQHKGQRHQSRVSRSLSMSVIDGSSQDGVGFPAGTGSSQSKERGWEGRNEPALVEELEEEGESIIHGEGRLIRQFGKQGSGRADLTLPSGVHTTPQGQIFLVDCGNTRIQVTDVLGNVMQQVKSPGSGSASRRCRNYFDVAVNSKGLIALSCAAERALLIFSRHGRLLQTYGGTTGPGAPPSADGLEAPRGVAVTRQDEFLVADIRKGTLTAMKLDPKTGIRLERTVVTGFHRPYLVAASPYSDLSAVSERGSETGREPCVKVLDSAWTTIRVLGVCSGMGPVLACPWGICIDGDGAVLVADWAGQHRVVLYPAQGIGRTVVSRGLSSPRGLALLPDGSLVVSDSMHHCVKIYQYK
ncbi:hypothetical protein ACEWY4_023261 [Coilia grayii]|uniref:E3 ubiquitin-protein ligase TRIM32 n=1 Tax=Coilia grayii TaxID=363190 RepID=A0ABD1J601_9TELE